jgi:hypothetical protein
MKPRLFYRSRLFWLGLPGLVFLLWGWWISLSHFSRVGFSTLGIAQATGDVFAHWRSGTPLSWGGFSTGHMEIPAETARDLKATISVWPQQDPNWHTVIIPYYAVVLAYVAPWLLVVAWWQRRKRRILKLHTAQ